MMASPSAVPAGAGANPFMAHYYSMMEKVWGHAANPSMISPPGGNNSNNSNSNSSGNNDDKMQGKETVFPLLLSTLLLGSSFFTLGRERKEESS